MQQCILSMRGRLSVNSGVFRLVHQAAPTSGRPHVHAHAHAHAHAATIKRGEHSSSSRQFAELQNDATKITKIGALVLND